MISIMGNSRAYPIRRTTDLAEVLDLTRRLLASVPQACLDSSLQGWARTEAELERLEAAFPEARFVPPLDRFPVSVAWDPATFEEAAEALYAGEGICPLSLSWGHLTWPPVPELNLGQDSKHAELQIALNSRDIHGNDPGPEHTVFVHTWAGEDERVTWLAAKAGAGIVGQPQFGW
ncbi:hypothetical protein [Kitasatospora sp. NPDC004289]